MYFVPLCLRPFYSVSALVNIEKNFREGEIINTCRPLYKAKNNNTLISRSHGQRSAAFKCSFTMSLMIVVEV